MVRSVGYFSYCLGLCMVAFGFGDLLCFVCLLAVTGIVLLLGLFAFIAIGWLCVFDGLLVLGFLVGCTVLC